MLKKQEKFILFEGVNKEFDLFNIIMREDDHSNYISNYRLEVPLSKSYIKTKISLERQTIFMDFLQCFAEMIDFKMISSYTILEIKMS